MNNRLTVALEESGLKLVSENPNVVCYIDNEKEFASGPAADRLIKEALDDYTEEVQIGVDVPEDAHLLIKWDGNWADEIDLSSFCVFNGKSWNAYRKKLEDHDMEIELYIGTNEELSFDNGKDLLSEMSVQFISEEEYEVINKLFDGGHDQAGIFDIELEEDEEDEHEEDEEDEDYDSEFANEDEDDDDLPGFVTELRKQGWDVQPSGEKDVEDEDIYRATHPDGSEVVGSYIMWSLL